MYFNKKKYIAYSSFNRRHYLVRHLVIFLTFLKDIWHFHGCISARTFSVVSVSVWSALNNAPSNNTFPKVAHKITKHAAQTRLCTTFEKCLHSRCRCLRL